MEEKFSSIQIRVSIELLDLRKSQMSDYKYANISIMIYSITIITITIIIIIIYHYSQYYYYHYYYCCCFLIFISIIVMIMISIIFYLMIIIIISINMITIIVTFIICFERLVKKIRENEKEQKQIIPHTWSYTILLITEVSHI